MGTTGQVLMFLAIDVRKKKTGDAMTAGPNMEPGTWNLELRAYLTSLCVTSWTFCFFLLPTFSPWIWIVGCSLRTC